jgi:hypothetical protein
MRMHDVVRRLAAFAVVISCAISVSAPAQARFGKGGGHGGGHGFRGGSSRGASSGGTRGSYWHGSASYARPLVGLSHGGGRASRGSVWVVAPRFGYLGYSPLPPAVLIGPPPASYPDAEEDDITPRRHTASSLDLGVTVAQDDTTMFGARVLFEGAAYGASLGYTAIVSPATDGSPAVDTFHLANVHMTVALLSGERGRLRAEFGAHLAVAPDVTFVAPAAGLSGSLALGAGFGLDARVTGNCWPFTEVDASAGLLWANDTVAVLAGARALYLNDNGALGAANAGDTSDFFYGPYAGLAFAL